MAELDKYLNKSVIDLSHHDTATIMRIAESLKDNLIVTGLNLIDKEINDECGKAIAETLKQ